MHNVLTTTGGAHCVSLPHLHSDFAYCFRCDWHALLLALYAAVGTQAPKAPDKVTEGLLLPTGKSKAGQQLPAVSHLPHSVLVLAPG